MEKRIYTKYADGRAWRFSLRTEILEDVERAGVYRIKKSPMFPEGKAHIYNMKKSYEALTKAFADSKAGVRINRFEESDEGLAFDFVKGESLQDKVLALAKLNEVDEIRKLFSEYYDLLCEMGEETAGDFVPSEEFAEVFGTGYSFGQEKVTKDIADIDLILSNIIVDDEGKKNIIDYEWCFFFPIPVAYIYYRSMHYFFHEFGSELPLTFDAAVAPVGIDEAKDEIYRQMEKNFQAYVKGKTVPLQEIRDVIGQEIYDFGKIVSVRDSRGSYKVYYGVDGGFSEENTCRFPRNVFGTEPDLLKIELKKNTSVLRLDPGEDACLMTIHKAYDDKGKKLSVETNGRQLSEGRYYFPKKDPFVLFSGWSSDAEKIYVSVFYDSLSENNSKEVNDFLQKKAADYATMQSDYSALQSDYAALQSDLAGVEQQLQTAMYAYDVSQSEIMEYRKMLVVRIYKKIANSKLGRFLSKITH